MRRDAPGNRIDLCAGALLPHDSNAERQARYRARREAQRPRAKRTVEECDCLVVNVHDVIRWVPAGTARTWLSLATTRQPSEDFAVPSGMVPEWRMLRPCHHDNQLGG